MLSDRQTDCRLGSNSEKLITSIFCPLFVRLLKNSFGGDVQKFLAVVHFTRGDVREVIASSKIDARTFLAG